MKQLVIVMALLFNVGVVFAEDFSFVLRRGMVAADFKDYLGAPSDYSFSIEGMHGVGTGTYNNLQIGDYFGSFRFEFRDSRLVNIWEIEGGNLVPLPAIVSWKTNKTVNESKETPYAGFVVILVIAIFIWFRSYTPTTTSYTHYTPPPSSNTSSSNSSSNTPLYPPKTYAPHMDPNNSANAGFPRTRG